MSARTKARKRAMDVLYEADQRGVDAEQVLLRVNSEATQPLNPWLNELVDGVVAHSATIDELIDTYSEGWPLSRMPAVDRALARIAVFELIYAADVPDAVTIDEIVGLAAEMSTDDSATFLNGLLSRIASVKHRLTFD